MGGSSQLPLLASGLGWLLRVTAPGLEREVASAVAPDLGCPMEKKRKKAKWLSVEALQIAVKRGEKQRRKGKI